LNIVSGKDFFMDCFLKGCFRRNRSFPQQLRICVHPRDCGAIAEIPRPRLFEMAGSGAIRRAEPAYHAMVTIVLEHDVNRRRTVEQVAKH
jgi:hypothetical protein